MVKRKTARAGTTRQFEFSKGALGALPAPGHGRAVYRDARNRRLYLRVTRKGVKSFYHVRKVNGRTEWTFLGRFPEMPVGVARERCDQVNGGYVKGGNPAEERRATRAAERAEPTLERLWTDYRDAYIKGATRGGGYSPRTLDSQWRVWLSPWKDRKLSAITDAMVEGLRDRIRDERSTTTANKILTHGRAMYAFAQKSRRIKYGGPNPFAMVEKFPERRSRKQRLKRSQVHTFFAALETVSPTMRDFFLCVLFIGARAGNIKAMRWEDLDLRGGVWTVPRSKSGEGYELALAQPVIDLLEARRRKVPSSCPWVFPAKSRSGHLTTYRKAWLRVCAHAGIKGLRVHDQRRTLSSWAQEANVAVALIQAQLGHLDPKTTLKHYTSIASPERRVAVDQTVRALMEAAQSEGAVKH